MIGVEWMTRIPPPGEAILPVVWIDVAKVDLAWAISENYVSKGGGCAGIPERYEQFGIWFELKVPIQIACIDLLDEAIEFIDGRHRFAWLRDHGVKIMPVHVPQDKVGIIKCCFEVVNPFLKKESCSIKP